MLFENVSERVVERRKVRAAVEARIRVQIEPFEEAIQIDLDVPHLVLAQPLVRRKALSTSIALKRLSIAHSTKMLRQIAFSPRLVLAVRTRMSNQSMNSVDVILKTSCSLIRFLAFSALMWFCDCCCCRRRS